MRFNFEAIKEDTRKIGVALIVGALLGGLLKESSFFDVAYAFFGGVILVFIGSIYSE